MAPYDCHGVSNYWQFDRLINSLFRLTAKETSKLCITAQIANFMGPAWGPPGSCRPQIGPTLAPWTLLSGWPFLWEIRWGPFDSLQGSQACRDFGKNSRIVICDSRPGNRREFHIFCLEFRKMRASEFFLKLKWWVMYFLQSRDASLTYLQAHM